MLVKGLKVKVPKVLKVYLARSTVDAISAVVHNIINITYVDDLSVMAARLDWYHVHKIYIPPPGLWIASNRNDPGDLFLECSWKVLSDSCTIGCKYYRII